MLSFSPLFALLAFSWAALNVNAFSYKQLSSNCTSTLISISLDSIAEYEAAYFLQMYAYLQPSSRGTSMIGNYSVPIVGTFTSQRLQNTITLFFDDTLTTSYPNAVLDVYVTDLSGFTITYPGSGGGLDLATVALPIQCSSGSSIFTSSTSTSTTTPLPTPTTTTRTSTSSRSTTSTTQTLCTNLLLCTSTPTPTPCYGGSNCLNQPSSKTPVGAIAGGVVGGVAAIVLLLLACCLLRRRRKRDSAATTMSKSEQGFNTALPNEPQIFNVAQLPRTTIAKESVSTPTMSEKSLSRSSLPPPTSSSDIAMTQPIAASSPQPTSQAFSELNPTSPSSASNPLFSPNAFSKDAYKARQAEGGANK